MPVAGEAAVLGSVKLALAGKELAEAPKPEPVPVAAPLAPAPPPVATFVPPVAGGDNGPAPAAGWAQAAAGWAVADGDEGGGYLDGDDDGLDSGWPAHPAPTPDVPGGRWLDKLAKLRERNFKLAAALTDNYIPRGSDSLTSVDTGYGFIVNDAFNLEWLVALEDRVDACGPDAADAKAAVEYASMVWWMLVELSATLYDTSAPRQTCPPELLAQHVTPDSFMNVRPGSQDAANGLPVMSDLMDVHKPVWPHARLRSFWCRLPPSQFAPVQELIWNVRAIYDLAEAAGLTVWEVETDGY